MLIYFAPLVLTLEWFDIPATLPQAILLRTVGAPVNETLSV
ncbi:MAG: hypothetical protein WBD16_08200 [Pyrinomonadaceae bacterium]